MTNFTARRAVKNNENDNETYGKKIAVENFAVKTNGSGLIVLFGHKLFILF
jgi:hypothetical protein